MRTRRDQLLPQRDDPAIAGGRAGFDDQQSVARFRPHQLSERAALRLACLADHVARHHKIGRFGISQCGAGFTVLVCHSLQPHAVAGEIERQRAQSAVGIEQRESLQR
jgi:hypothetical protein